MLEDKLSQDERLRLECLAQAVQYQILERVNRPVETVIDIASKMEKFVREGKTK